MEKRSPRPFRIPERALRVLRWSAVFASALGVAACGEPGTTDGSITDGEVASTREPLEQLMVFPRPRCTPPLEGNCMPPGAIGGLPVCTCVPTLPTPTNISRDKPSWQSSTAWGGIAARGNDGNTDGYYWAESVTHTGTGFVYPSQPHMPGQHWYVYLSPNFGPERIVRSVTLYNRTDCCQERLTNHNLVAWNSADEEWQEISDDADDIIISGDSIIYDFRENVILTRYVMVAKTDDDVLSLAEVRVMGF